MKHLLGPRLLFVFAVLAVATSIGADAASATKLYQNTQVVNDPQGAETAIEASLKAGSSLTLEETEEELLVDTCTTSKITGKLEKAGGEGSHPSGKATLSFSGCTHTTDVLEGGELEVRHIAGTTNGIVFSKGARVTVPSTYFGISCTANTGAGVTIGTLTGAGSGEQATLDVNALIPMGFLCGGDARLTGTYTITSPTGLVVEAEPKSGSKLYQNTQVVNDPQGAETAIEASLKAGSSLTLEETEEELLVDTCTTSKITGKLEKAGGEGSHPSGKATLSFSGCTHTTDVLEGGELEVRHIAGTTNGTVYSKGAQVTVPSTYFGISCTANTGTGVAIGTLTGAGSGEQATLDVNAVIPMGFFCGGDARLTGTYTITSPTGLVVEDK